MQLVYILALVYQCTPSTEAQQGLRIPITELQESEWVSDNANTSQVIRIGTALTLNYSTKYGDISRLVYYAYTLYFDWLNRVHGGIRLHGSTYPVQLLILDDKSEKDRVAKITEHLITNMHVRHLLAPYGSALTGVAAEIADEHGAVMVAPCASSPSVFINRTRVFGTNSKSAAFLETAIKTISLQSALGTIVYLQEDLTFTKGVCGTIAPLAEQEGMRVVSGETVVDDAGEDEVREAVMRLQAKIDKPDLLIGCVYNNVCQRMLKASRDLGYNPNAIVLTICVTLPDFLKSAGNAGAYVMGVTPWARSLTFRSNLTKLRVPEFVELYESTYPGTFVPYQAANSFSACAALVAAIERAGTLDPGAVAYQLDIMDETSVAGMVVFDQNGQNKNDFKVVQYQHTNMAVVAPSSVSNGQMQYPKPTWNAIECLDQDQYHIGRFGIAPDGSCSPCGESQISPFNANLGYRVCENMNCEEGKYSIVFEAQGDLRAGALCDECHRGYFSDTRGVSMCSSCLPGTYQDEKGQTACLPCSPGKYTDSEGSTECIKCGEIDAEYAAGYNNSRCTPCPPGAQCIPDNDGLYTNFTNADGHFLLIPDGGSSVDGSIYKCKHGNDGDVCRAGAECAREDGTGEFVAEGDFCGMCRPGFGRAGMYDECQRCPSTGWMWFSAIFNVFLVFVIAQVVFVIVVFSDFTRPQDIKAIIVKQVLNYAAMAQVVFSVVEVRTPDFFIPHLFSILLGDTSPGFGALAANCVAEKMSDNNSRYVFYAMSSLIWVPAWIVMLAIMFFIVWQVAQCQKGKNPLSASRFFTLLTVNLYVIHSRSTSLSLLVLRCHRFDGPRLLMHTDLHCHDSTVVESQILGVISLVLYSLGIPFCMYLLLKLYKHNNKLFSRKIINTFGFLYSGFEAEHYYFEPIFMLRKVLYQVIVLVPGWTGADDERAEKTLACVCMLVLAVVFLAVHNTYEPFDNRAYFTLDRIEAASLWAILVTLLIESWRLITDKARAFTEAEDAETFTDIRDWTATIIILSIHLRFLFLLCYLTFRNTFESAYREERHNQDIVRCTIDGVEVLNATRWGLDLFGATFNELASLLIDSSGTVDYQVFTESVQYMCVDCRYHRFRDMLPPGAALVDDDATAMAMAIKKKVNEMYILQLFEYFILEPVRRICKCVTYSVSKSASNLPDWMQITVSEMHGKPKKEKWTENGMQILENLEKFRVFNRENLNACVGMKFGIDEFHMAMVRLQRELRSRSFNRSPTDNSATSSKTASLFGLTGFMKKVQEGPTESVVERLGYLIKGRNIPEPVVQKVAFEKDQAARTGKKIRKTGIADPLEHHADNDNSFTPEQLLARTSTVESDVLSPAEMLSQHAATPKSSPSNISPSAGRQSDSGRVSFQLSTTDSMEYGVGKQDSTRAFTVGAHASMEVGQDASQQDLSPKRNSVGSALFGESPWNLQNSGLPVVGRGETVSTMRSDSGGAQRLGQKIGQVRSPHVFHEDIAEESFLKQLAFAAQKIERQAAAEKGLTSEVGKLRDIVSDVQKAKQEILEVQQQCELEMQAKDAELNAAISQVEELRQKKQNVESSHVLTLLQGLSLDSSDEEDEERGSPKRKADRTPKKRKSEVKVRCSGCHRALEANHKYCITCGRSRHWISRGHTPSQLDKDILYEVEAAKEDRGEMEDEQFKLQLQMETAKAVEEHQSTLLAAAEEEVHLARVALANQASEYEQLSQESVTLRAEAADKVEKIQMVEEQIQTVREQIQTLSSTTSAMSGLPSEMRTKAHGKYKPQPPPTVNGLSSETHI